MKFIKKLSPILLLAICLISTTVFATEINSQNSKLEIVENNVCTISIGNIATFEKKIVDYDLDKKELTIGLTITNNMDGFAKTPAEIVLVIDNSISMNKNNVSDGVTRLKAVTDSAKTLATKLLEKNSENNIKIAVVSFSTNDANEGTLSDASIRTPLTSDSNVILSAINMIATDTSLGARTNIDAGLQIGYSCFSAETNSKYLVLLTDGVPNTAVGGPTQTYSGDVTSKTKATLQNLSDNNININSCMIGLDTQTEEPTTHKTYKELAEEVFGTVNNPTVGNFYYVPDNKIEDYICETVFSNIIDEKSNTLNNLDIYDYFPQEILENFDFEYVIQPTVGTVSPTIDLENGCIIWHFDKLEPGVMDTFSYKLTLKEKINSEIINIVLNTNKKIDITANEIKTDDGSNIISSTVFPKVKVTISNEKTPVDDSTADKEIPQAGNNNIILAILIISSVIICSILFIRFKLIKVK